MKKLILQNDHGLRITIKKFDHKQLSGSLVINSPEICSTHEINSNCIRISDSLYHLFFCIQCNNDYSKNMSYTIFNGKLLLNKINKTELILDWFCVCNKLEGGFKIGQSKLSNCKNHKTKIDYQSYQHDAYPLFVE